MVKKGEEKGESSDLVQIVSHNSAIGGFSTCIKWAEKNRVGASGILTFKKLYDNVLKQS